ncbi:glucans biosynthesis glucosyltransferase MdoH [Lysobacter ciconiae]|uniref:Glucans biosynthesis glucosyltransferase H n=1 Tax=Novilysobacter ciconiae TaxID=2781022 RepID=A0A7S6UIK9_9GAMM|nr:glucans biosynthesis glucosyltransferase MdoH [Lysobacter ciconiae]QOW20895.1 glucans biosynthesis glucosyltransferase MdoH [Lysobacter ciconiae]
MHSLTEPNTGATGTAPAEIPARSLEMAMVPPEAALAMPVQSFEDSAPAAARLAGSPLDIVWRRLIVLGGTAGLTLLATYQLWWAMRGGGHSALEWLSLVLFAALFVWVAQGFMSALAGFALIVNGYRRRDRLGVIDAGPLPALTTRTALLMPTYNEDPERLMAGLQSICESVLKTRREDAYDFFVLSDTTRPEVQQRELAAFHRLRDTLGGQVRLYYRHRPQNIDRKAGNIAEWVRRFGAAYPQMLILDADSLMTGKGINRLAVAMERHPEVGLIQTLPVVVNGSTIFGRMQQFAGRVYGPVLAHGNAWWHGTEGNYWGHNAIIRTAAFASCAGLPELPGSRPFGGSILSHDFVEAALLRRGGWEVHLVPALGGSYEEGPPSLTDMLVRDRRWCQGNLQHGGVIPAKGLHWVSRWHLLTGIGHYITAPLWGALMLIGLVMTMASSGLQWDSLVFPRIGSAADWTGPKGMERFFWVFMLTMSLLLGPKLLGFILALTDPWARRSCGGALRLTAGVLVETLLTTLMAPVTMYVQSRGVIEVLAGRDSGWESQRRDDGTLTRAELWQRYGGVTVCGVVGAAWSFAVSPWLMLWMSPVLLGLMLSMPLVALTADPEAGRRLRRWGIFLTPEEVSPPPILTRVQGLRGGLTQPVAASGQEAGGASVIASATAG